MSYGPGFMKGFKNASKGVISRLFSGIKGKLGTFATKALGPVGNWAKNVGYKMGFGLAERTGEGLLSKAWNSPGSLIKKARSVGWVSKLNNSDFARASEKKAAKFENMGWVNKVDGLGEKMGEGVGDWNKEAATEFKVGSKTFKPESSRRARRTNSTTRLVLSPAKTPATRCARKSTQDIIGLSRNRNNQIADNGTTTATSPKRTGRALGTASARRRQPRAQRREVVSNTEGRPPRRRRASTARSPSRSARKSTRKTRTSRTGGTIRRSSSKRPSSSASRRTSPRTARKPRISPMTSARSPKKLLKELKHENQERQMIPFKSGDGGPREPVGCVQVPEGVALLVER